MNGPMNASGASQKTRRNCTERYLRGLRNQNVEHVNQCESSILETQVIA